MGEEIVEKTGEIRTGSTQDLLDGVAMLGSWGDKGTACMGWLGGPALSAPSDIQDPELSVHCLQGGPRKQLPAQTLASLTPT